MKKIIATILAAVIALSCLGIFASAAWDGSSTESYTGTGTEADPYVIDTAAKLAKIAETVNGGDSLEGKYFTQTADIDLGGKEWTPIGTLAAPFSGIYNGQGHKITGFSITKISANTGLFGSVTATAANEAGIANLTLEGSINVTGDGKDAEDKVIGAPLVGAIAGNAGSNKTLAEKTKDTIFTNVTSKVNITLASQTQQPRLGGFFGQSYVSVLENCVNDGSITTDSTNTVRLGGFCGQANRTSFTNCVNNGNLSAKSSNAVNVGGFIAYATTQPKADTLDTAYGVMTNCINNGSVTGESTANKTVACGGIVSNAYTNTAVIYLKVNNCLNTGSVKATQPDGGSTYSFAGGIFGTVPAYDYIYSDGCVNTAAAESFASVGGNGARMGGIIGSIWAAAKQISVTNCVSACATAGLYNTPTAADDKATWKEDAAAAAEKAAAIKGAVATSYAKINGIEVTKEASAPAEDPVTPQNPDTGDALIVVMAVAAVALAGAAFSLKAGKSED